MEGIIGLERKALIIANIVVGFDFINLSQEYHANDFLAHFNTTEESVTLDEIKQSLVEFSFQKALKKYGLEYFRHRTEEHDVSKSGATVGWRIKSTLGGICNKVLAYEFPGINENISCKYDNADRIKAISRRLHKSDITNIPANLTSGNKRELSSIQYRGNEDESNKRIPYEYVWSHRTMQEGANISSTPSHRSVPMSVSVSPDDVKLDLFESSTAEEQIETIFSMLDIAKEDTKTIVKLRLIDDFDIEEKRNRVIGEAVDIIEGEILNHQSSLEKDGLNRSKTYAERSFESPVPKNDEKVDRAKKTLPMLFEVLMILISSKKLKDKDSALTKRMQAMTKTFEDDIKNDTRTSSAELLHILFGERIPGEISAMFNSAPSVGFPSTSASSTVTSSADTPSASTTASSVDFSIASSTNPKATCISSTADIPYAVGKAVTAFNYANDEENGHLGGMQRRESDTFVVCDDVKLAELIAMINAEREDCNGTIRKKEILAASVCDMILQMRENGSALTPTGVELGLLTNLFGLSNSGQVTLRTRGLMCGRSTTKKILDGLGAVYDDFVKDLMASNHGKRTHKLLVIFDNYNILKWLKRMVSNDTFTQNIPSISILVKLLLCEEPPDGQANIPFDFKALKESMGESWKLDEEFQGVVDDSHMQQSLFNFYPIPSVHAKSSSEKDMKKLIVQELLTVLCNMGSDEVAVVVDPEILLILAKLFELDPALMKNIIICPPIFHIRKHLIENMMCDPVFLLLFGIPCYAESYGLQVSKQRLKWKSLIKMMEKRIKDFKQNVINDLKKAEDKEKKRIEKENKKNKIINNNNEHNEYLEVVDDILIDATETQTAISNKKSSHPKCSARTLVDSTADSDDDSDSEDDEEEGYDGLDKGPARKKICDDEEMREVMTLVREYCELGLRGTDLSHKELAALKMNFARQWNITGQIVIAMRSISLEVKELFLNKTDEIQTDETADTPLGNGPSWSAALVVDMLENGLDKYCTQPFSDIVLEGKGQRFIELFLDMAYFMAHYDRRKVGRSYIALINAFAHWKNIRHDLMRFYLCHCCSFNDLFIELLNSLIASALPTNMKICPEDITKASGRVYIKNRILKNANDQDNVIGNKGSKGQGEVRIEELKCITSTSSMEAKRLSMWVLGHIKRLNNIVTDASLVYPGAKRWENMNTMKGLLERGQDIFNDRIIPEYEEYLNKEKLKQQSELLAQFQDKLEKVLRSVGMTIEFMKVPLAAKNIYLKDNKDKNISNKEFCIAKITEECVTFNEFKNFIIKWDVNSLNQKDLVKMFTLENKNPAVTPEISEGDDMDE